MKIFLTLVQPFFMLLCTISMLATNYWHMSKLNALNSAIILLRDENEKLKKTIEDLHTLKTLENSSIVKQVDAVPSFSLSDDIFFLVLSCIIIYFVYILVFQWFIPFFAVKPILAITPLSAVVPQISNNTSSVISEIPNNISTVVPASTYSTITDSISSFLVSLTREVSGIKGVDKYHNIIELKTTPPENGVEYVLLTVQRPGDPGPTTIYNIAELMNSGIVENTRRIIQDHIFQNPNTLPVLEVVQEVGQSI